MSGIFCKMNSSLGYDNRKQDQVRENITEIYAKDMGTNIGMKKKSCKWFFKITKNDKRNHSSKRG